MLAALIRNHGALVYNYPRIAEDIVRSGKFGRLKLALVADIFSTKCLSEECRIRHVTPSNYREVIDSWRPDVLLVESVFHGHCGCWRYRVAKQPKYIRLSKPRTIFKVIQYARSQGIPSVFWNKDDGAFFEHFIDVAKEFDYIFTTDEGCVERYRRHVPSHVPVNTLVMPYQPLFHNFTGFNFSRNEACFVGSYYRRILNERKLFLDMVFDICEETDLRLNAFDRNKNRLSRHFEFRFPKKDQIYVHDKVPHSKTGQIYKSHVISLNVNSVTDSETMYSRRLLEILACGGIAVTNPSRAVERYFRDYCHVVNSREEVRELFSRLRYGPSQEDMERAEAGAMYVKNQHTWAHRLEELCAIVNL
jgi:spore maturation protein CgeB